jgi:hypothetical protein
MTLNVRPLLTPYSPAKLSSYYACPLIVIPSAWLVCVVAEMEGGFAAWDAGGYATENGLVKQAAEVR